MIITVQFTSDMILLGAWIFPTCERDIYYCKNPLYIKNGEIRLHIYPKGFLISSKEIKELYKNRFLGQKYSSIHAKEFNILLTLDEFNELF